MDFSLNGRALHFDGSVADDQGEPTGELARIIIHLPDDGSSQNHLVKLEVFRSDLATPWKTKTIAGESPLEAIDLAIRFTSAFLTPID